MRRGGDDRQRLVVFVYGFKVAGARFELASSLREVWLMRPVSWSTTLSRDVYTMQRYGDCGGWDFYLLTFVLWTLRIVLWTLRFNFVESCHDSVILKQALYYARCSKIWTLNFRVTFFGISGFRYFGISVFRFFIFFFFWNLSRARSCCCWSILKEYESKRVRANRAREMWVFLRKKWVFLRRK